mgnify:CR=1 FL=1|jgi:hypothetical protein
MYSLIVESVGELRNTGSSHIEGLFFDFWVNVRVNFMRTMRFTKGKCWFTLRCELSCKKFGKDVLSIQAKIG